MIGCLLGSNISLKAVKLIGWTRLTPPLGFTGLFSFRGENKVVINNVYFNVLLSAR